MNVNQVESLLRTRGAVFAVCEDPQPEVVASDVALEDVPYSWLMNSQRLHNSLQALQMPPLLLILTARLYGLP